MPVMRGRVAPVLNWCSQILLFHANAGRGPVRELRVPGLAPLERLTFLRDQGVEILICGALSTDLHNLAIHMGFRIISGIAGEVDEIVEAYRQNRLDQPEFWLPGCQGPRRYRQGFGKENCLSVTREQLGEGVMPGGRGGKGAKKGKGSCQADRHRRAGGPGGPGSGKGAGISEFCICPSCGTKAPHERGIPCLLLSCPQCGKAMVRQIS
jgi:predicted Fe-Mo cluster-binding NifX family protein